MKAKLERLEVVFGVGKRSTYSDCIEMLGENWQTLEEDGAPVSVTGNLGDLELESNAVHWLESFYSSSLTRSRLGP